MPWPYPIKYGHERIIETDVLIIGGGIAGCHAALAVHRKGVAVAVVDKGPVIRSGSGGAGVDHWHGACTNPASTISPDEKIELFRKHCNNLTLSEFGAGPTTYILFRESYDALLDVEQMGVNVRDVDGEFIGAEFRDEDSKLLFAYDYKIKDCIRVQGADIKVALYKQMKRSKIAMHERIMVTCLLTEGGHSHRRVVGATGINTRTGEFFIFKSKAVILSTGPTTKLWVFSTELCGANAAHDDPNCVGDGDAIAWNAGAEFTLMEASGKSGGGFRYPAYGTGNAHNTWFPCTLVDANGKEIPWVDRDGRAIETVSGRCQPAEGQRMFIHSGPAGSLSHEFDGPRLIPDLARRIKNGEYELPFYADLPGMPAHERRAIFGLMVGHEGKTAQIYKSYAQAGFDPDKDMLQANVLPIAAAGEFQPYWNGGGAAQWRETAFGGGGGVVFDWNLMTTLPGLYAAGNQLAGGSNHAGAATTGRYAGRKAAMYALNVAFSDIDSRQVAAEKERVYAPVRRSSGPGWKELQAGICRIMQDYCGEFKSEATLRTGLRWLDSIRKSEAARVHARNPHELARSLECISRLTVGEIIMHSCLARQASSEKLNFKRLDFPDIDPPEKQILVTLRKDKDAVVIGERSPDFWLEPPYQPTYRENYEKHCGI